MPISGLVVTLRDAEPARTALAAMESDPRIEVGEPRGGTRVPIVTETESADEAESLVRELMLLEGVHTVDVVCIDLSLDVLDARGSESNGLTGSVADRESTHGPA